MSHWITLALLALTSLTVGCEVNRQSAQELAIAETQAVIQTYSEKIERADELQASFVEAWESANEIKDLQIFREAMTSSVIPKLTQYQTWLEGMLPKEDDSKELNGIHGKVVEGYRTAVAAFNAFVTELSEENIEERYRVLMSAMNELARLEEAYVVELKNFYSNNRVRLVGEAGKIAADNEPAAAPVEAKPKSGGH